MAEWAEAELGEEQASFVEGCPAQWADLPIPEGRIVVGLDGGYVRDWDDRKANFLVNRRMNKAQQMHWTRHDADRLPQVRCAVYNGTLGTGFG